MAERFRLDLDGVGLKDDNGRVVCILRFRTMQGLVLRLPESVDTTVPWRLVEEAVLDLRAGTLRVKFIPGAAAELPWLQTWTELSGQWTDRAEMAAPPSPR